MPPDIDVINDVDSVDEPREASIRRRQSRQSFLVASFAEIQIWNWGENSYLLNPSGNLSPPIKFLHNVDFAGKSWALVSVTEKSRTINNKG